MQRLNPTGSLLRARPFVARHDYVYALLCLLNINMGALNLCATPKGADEGWEKGAAHTRTLTLTLTLNLTPPSAQTAFAYGLLEDMESVFREMTPEARQRVRRRVTQSGGLPVSRDTPSYTAVLLVLHGGRAVDSANSSARSGDFCRQSEQESPVGPVAESKIGGRAYGGAWGQVGSGEEDGEDWAGGRKAAKNEAAERVRKLSQCTVTNPPPDHPGAAHHARGQRAPHNTTREEQGGSPGIAESKEGEGSPAKKMTHLADLPDLGFDRDQPTLVELKKQRVRVNLGLPKTASSAENSANRHGSRHRHGQAARGRCESGVEGSGGSESKGTPSRGQERDEKENGGGKRNRKRRPVPSSATQNPWSLLSQEFLCSINKHMMKEPTRSPHGHAFETSTILLWLESRGDVCPLTGKPLHKEDLVPDRDLRTRIMRWHIQKTTVGAGSVLEGDDIYDF
ncbi:unnamed protein product [Discosporangium mesarthrocarpum]